MGASRLVAWRSIYRADDSICKSSHSPVSKSPLSICAAPESQSRGTLHSEGRHEQPAARKHLVAGKTQGDNTDRELTSAGSFGSSCSPYWIALSR